MSEKVYLDDETKKALKGLAPFSAEVSFEFTPVYYEKRGVKSEFRPVYSLRVFTKNEQDSILECFSKTDTECRKKLFEITQKVVLGWKNVIDIATSELIEYKGDKNGATEAAFSLITKVDRESIFDYVMLMSGMRKVEALGLGS